MSLHGPFPSASLASSPPPPCQTAKNMHATFSVTFISVKCLSLSTPLPVGLPFCFTVLDCAEAAYWKSPICRCPSQKYPSEKNLWWTGTLIHVSGIGSPSVAPRSATLVPAFPRCHTERRSPDKPTECIHYSKQFLSQTSARVPANILHARKRSVFIFPLPVLHT